MATIDVGQSARIPAKFVEQGLVGHVFRFSASLTLSAGDIFRLGKLPAGFIPVDAIWIPRAGSGGAGVVKIGTSASQELFFASATYSVVTRTIRPLGTTVRISLSDDVPRFDNVVAVPTAGISVGHVGDLIVYGVNDFVAE